MNCISELIHRMNLVLQLAQCTTVFPQLSTDTTSPIDSKFQFMYLFACLFCFVQRNPLFVVMLLNQGAFDCMIRFLLGPATAATAAPGNNGQVETNVDTGVSTSKHYWLLCVCAPRRKSC